MDSSLLGILVTLAQTADAFRHSSFPIYRSSFSCKGIGAQSHLGYMVISEVPAWSWQYGIGLKGAGLWVEHLCSGTEFNLFIYFVGSHWMLVPDSSSFCINESQDKFISRVGKQGVRSLGGIWAPASQPRTAIPWTGAGGDMDRSGGSVYWGSGCSGKSQ